MRAAQDARPTGSHLRQDFRADLLHPSPMRLGVPVVFLMIAVVEEHPVIKAMVGAHGVGVIIPRLSAVVQNTADFTAGA